MQDPIMDDNGPCEDQPRVGRKPLESGHKIGMDLMNVDALLRLGVASEVYEHRIEFRRVLDRIREHVGGLERIRTRKCIQHSLEVELERVTVGKG